MGLDQNLKIFTNKGKKVFDGYFRKYYDLHQYLCSIRFGKEAIDTEISLTSKEIEELKKRFIKVKHYFKLRGEYIDFYGNETIPDLIDFFPGYIKTLCKFFKAVDSLPKEERIVIYQGGY